MKRLGLVLALFTALALVIGTPALFGKEKQSGKPDYPLFQGPPQASRSTGTPPVPATPGNTKKLQDQTDPYSYRYTEKYQKSPPEVRRQIDKYTREHEKFRKKFQQQQEGQGSGGSYQRAY